MTDPVTKLLPFAVSVKAAPPAVAEVGLMLVSAGAGLLIVKVCALVTPPPGAGLKTVTLAVPAVAILAASILAVNFILLTQVVVRSVPFQRMTEPVTKLLPFAVSVKAAPPAVAEVGLILVSAGARLLIVKVCALVTPPPGVGLKTVTLAVPAVAILAASILAVNFILLTRVVTRSVPFQRITAPETKLLPFAVSIKTAPPAVAEVGLILVSPGAGLLIVKVCALVVPPPGVGLKTVTLAVPAVAILAASILAVN
jgi:hypothetical protein